MSLRKQYISASGISDAACAPEQTKAQAPKKFKFIDNDDETLMAGMEPAAVVPNHEAPKGARRPSTLTLSSRSLKSPEPSPTRSRDSEGELGRTATAEQESWGPFTFVGPERKRFHANRQHAPYPFPCGMEELSRFDRL